MATNIKITYDADPDGFVGAIFHSLYGPIATAASAAVHEAGNKLLALGRADIAAAGFSARWQNALRVKFYPEGGAVTVDAAAYVHHKFIHYAGIFDTGGTIVGRPLLWLALPGVPLKIGSKRFTPRNVVAEGLHLVTMTSRKGTPMLGALAAGSSLRGSGRDVKPTLSSLRRGAGGFPGAKVVPLFVGIRQATIGKRLHIRELANTVRGQLPGRYLKNVEASGG